MHAIALAIVCIFLLVLPSCGIPDLRPSKPAPGVPEEYPIRKPESDSALPEIYPAISDDQTSAENSAQLRIEEFFSDPTLTALIGQALAGNQELRILNEDIRIANNVILARTGSYLPFVTIGAGAGAEKPSLFTREGAVDNSLDIIPGTPIPNPLPNFLVAANVTWQIDVWRQLRNARDAAIVRYFSTSEGRNYLVTRMVAEIAENYYTLMALDQRLLILDSIIALQEQSLKAAEAKKAAARGTELAVQRFLAEVRKNQSEKLIVRQEIIQVENRINFLSGRFPMPIPRQSAQFIDLNLHTLSLGVPAQLLQNRPDIRQAERELAATGLDIKVARARFFPVVALNGAVGYSAFNPRYLLITPEALIANVVGDLVAPLVNKRAIKADYMTANARQLQAIYNYQRVIINGFTEVVNRVSKVENYRRSIEIKKLQVQSLEASVDNATKLFLAAHPDVDYMDVLFAQRDLMDARSVLVDTKRQQLSAIVNAYQALGGGGYLLPTLNPDPPPPHRLLSHQLFSHPLFSHN
jgi:NodT family efflux transporter outer membrane factor (OMF) lipoprotein